MGFQFYQSTYTCLCKEQRVGSGVTGMTNKGLLVTGYKLSVLIRMDSRTLVYSMVGAYHINLIIVISMYLFSNCII